MALFIVVAAGGFLYFAVAKRTFDLLALGFFSACFYFLPGFVGYAGSPNAAGLDEVPIAAGTYVVMTGVLAALLGSAIVWDTSIPHRPMVRADGTYWQFVTPLLTALAVVGCGLALLTIGSNLFTLSKFELLQELNRWFLLWTTAATIGFVAAVMEKRYLLATVNLLLLLLDLFIGFRLEITIAFLAVATMKLSDMGPQRLVRQWKLAAVALVLCVGLFFYKYFYVLFRLQAWDFVMDQIGNPDLVRLIFFQSEPFIIQGVLNEVIRHDLRVGMDHLMGCLYLFVPFASELGAQFTGFDKLFQPKLFPAVTEYGIGSNIWAEMYASGGWALLLLFVVGYTQTLAISLRLVQRVSTPWAATLCVMLAYWAFYIHRNDLLFEITLVRRAFLTAAVCAAGSCLMVMAVRSGADRKVAAG